MPTYFITGARRGIGLEYVRQLSTSPENTIAAVVRNLNDDLESLENIRMSPHNKARILFLECDLSNRDSIADLPSQFPADLRINTLIQNSAILRDSSRAETPLTINPDSFYDHFKTNAVGPALLIQAMAPFLAYNAVVANITSGLGSLALLSDGSINAENPAYSISKTALNMLTVHQAKELKGKAIVVCLDPGHVKTKMGGPNAVLEIDYSAKSVLKTLGRLREEDTGKFLLFDGKNLPW